VCACVCVCVCARACVCMRVRWGLICAPDAWRAFVLQDSWATEAAPSASAAPTGAPPLLPQRRQRVLSHYHRVGAFCARVVL